MGTLGTAVWNGGDRPEEALRVFEANLALRRRYFLHDKEGMLRLQSNCARCLHLLGRHDEAQLFERELYRKWRAALGATHEITILAAINLVESLAEGEATSEALTLLRRVLPDAQRGLGERHNLTFRAAGLLADLVTQTATSREQMGEANALVQKYFETVRHAFGSGHPLVQSFLNLSEQVRAKLASFPA